MITVVRDLAPYRTSRNYGRLWLLAQEKSYVCIVDFPRTTEGPPLRDVAQTIAVKDGVQVVRVAATCRGVEYASGETPEEFAHAATAVNLEWIEPVGGGDLIMATATDYKLAARRRLGKLDAIRQLVVDALDDEPEPRNLVPALRKMLAIIDDDLVTDGLPVGRGG